MPKRTQSFRGMKTNKASRSCNTYLALRERIIHFLLQKNFLDY